MRRGKLVAICQFGGKLVPNNDGCMSYSGGEAHVVPVDHNMTFNEFKSDLADISNHDISTMSVKYLLPQNKRTLITISNDKGLQRMVDLCEDMDTIDVYILAAVTNTYTASVSNLVEHRSKMTQNNSSSRPTKATTKVPIRSSARLKNKSVSDGNLSLDTVEPSVNTSIADVVEKPVSIIPAADQEIRAITNGPTRRSARIKNKSVGNANHFITIDEPQLDTITVDNVEQAGSIITGVGQEFNDSHEFRDALRRYAISKGIVLHYIRSSPSCYTAKCKADGCPWRIHASRLPILQKFRIKKLNNEHTCDGGIGQDGHPEASIYWIASVIKEKLRENPLCTPKKIQDDILQDYGVKVSYAKAYRGKEKALEQLQASRADSYSQLPWYCDRIKETNPGSIVTLATTDESRFHRLFICLNAARHGFENGCRPLVFLNQLSLKTKHLGIMLVASSVDAEGGIFPIAFAIVEAETYNSWHWFLSELKSALSASRLLTFLSDTHNGLEAAVAQVFEDCYHGFCLDDLLEKFRMELTAVNSRELREVMIEKFKRAAFTCKVDDFNDYIGSIRKVSDDIASWVLSSKYEHWSNAFFKGLRYNYFSSKFVETFYNGWVPEENDITIIHLLDTIRGKMMELFEARREASCMWSTTLTPSLEEKLQITLLSSRPLNMLISSDTVFEVRGNSVEIVDIEMWECTCRQWRISGLPCVHAVAVLDRIGRNVYAYCSRYLTVDFYRSTYSESIKPIPDVGNPPPETYIPSIVVKSPLHRIPNSRGPGRPRQNRIERVERKRSLSRFCSRCKEPGHSKKVCRVPLLEQ